MKCPHLLVLGFVSVLVWVAGVARAQTPSKVPKADTQNWNDIQLTVPLEKKVDFVLQGTLRIGDNITRPVDERWGIGFVFKINRYLSFSPSYFHREATPPNGKHETEERATLGATLRFPLGKFSLIDRNAFERRWRHPQVNAWRYRNRVQLEHPFKINKVKFTFFVSDEVFYDWSLHDWVRNRFSVGANHAFNKHFTLEVYGMRQNDGRTRPGDIDIIGTVMRFRL